MAGRIDVEGLRVKRGSFSLEVDKLSVEPREVFAILGETGAGKTVLLESIAGAFPFSAGHILLDGKDVETLPIQQRHLGIVYQDYALFPHMTVYENVAYGLRMNGCPPSEIDQRVGAVLELFSIERIAESYPGIISGGESQRVALSRALVLEPDILLLDEPFSALDPATKERLYATLRDVHERFDCTIVFVTHDFEEARRLADRVAVILGGRLCAVVPAAELFDQMHDAEVARFLGL
ncbi:MULTISPECIES: ABC transporter ATP-binding protein [Gordonibacter]|uniref:ATP-binding cassette domain-containing protein n=1 Tax=Gordonibacter faecis TaxID=3047475 RepID=A0ABT7DJF9_9ACTN|nr:MULTISPECIES: ATP-binding cassette domain-containing protein [unclassified Gordonibacter]MDJ1649656.1 ATP-binding cassette domain-containing protein [Gordonibacter sp. KGMB12511]HIW76459.1 ATP-binding cassette domain-containing protein [Candidatus Gordonibacter avicola]